MAGGLLANELVSSPALAVTKGGKLIILSGLSGGGIVSKTPPQPAPASITRHTSWRRAFGIEDGTRIVVETDEKDQRIILTPVTREHIQRMRGRFRGSNLLKALASDKAREKAR